MFVSIFINNLIVIIAVVLVFEIVYRLTRKRPKK